jgi:hypothetical protein
MKLAVAVASLLLSASATAAVQLGDIASAISCNSEMSRTWWQREFKAAYGKPRLEQGALWFDGKGELYGKKILEVFVSADPWYRFVGVVLDTKPEEVIPAIRVSRVYPTNVFESGAQGWVGADGRNIMWHKGQHTKIFCMGARQAKFSEI